jgi:hypothetical protein
MSRRSFLVSTAASAACAALRPLGVRARIRPLVYADMHSHQQFAHLEEILAKRGLKTGEIRGLLGANYLRALRAALII